MSWIARVKALLGVSAYALPAARAGEPLLSSPQVEQLRRAHGGQLQPLTTSTTRWYLADLEQAELAADAGDLSGAARLMRAARKDGVYAGVLSTRTEGLVRLPKRFRGHAEIVATLELGHERTRSIFDEMFPPSELALMAADGIELGVSVGELVPVEGRDHPVLVRLSPEFLRYRWHDNRWFFNSVAGPIPIVPGDGRWILHVPGGRVTPWQHGLWRAIGRAYIRKEHAALYKDNWEAKLANPARVAVAPTGAGEEQHLSWFQKVMAWGVNTTFALKPGYDIKLLESNGRGAESFGKTIAEQNDEFKLAVAGQLVTSDGGAGFQNSDIHKSIRADLIKATADSLAYTLNTQGIPQWVYSQFGEHMLEDGAVVEWDVTPPKDRSSEAQSLLTAAQAIVQITDALAQHGKKVDVDALASKFGIPVAGELEKQVQPKKLDLAPTDLAKVVKAVEARSSQGLPPFGDDRDEQTVSQLGERVEAQAEIAVDAAAAAHDPAEQREAA